MGSSEKDKKDLPLNNKNKDTGESDYLGKLDINYDVFNSKPNDNNNKEKNEEFNSFDQKIRDLNL